MGQIELYVGDITTLEVDAIVNAANAQLAGGGGVDGAIHQAAGPQLMEACSAIGGCATGSAVITPGFDLPARYVIHAVGPVYHGGGSGEAEALAGCYTTAMDLARSHRLTSIAFSAISTGVYGYPLGEACRVAVQAVNRSWVEDHPVKRVIMVCFNADVHRAFKAALLSEHGR